MIQRRHGTLEDEYYLVIVYLPNKRHHRPRRSKLLPKAYQTIIASSHDNNEHAGLCSAASPHLQDEKQIMKSRQLAIMDGPASVAVTHPAIEVDLQGICGNRRQTYSWKNGTDPFPPKGVE